MKGGKIQAQIIKKIKRDWKNFIIGKIFKLESPSLIGVPDIEFLYKGWALFIEVKGDNDRLKEHQKFLHNDWRQHGNEIYIAESIEDGVWLVLDFVFRKMRNK